MTDKPAQITAISVVERDPNLVRVAVNGDQIYTISLSDLSELGISVGSELPPERLVELAALSDRARALGAAIQLLTHRPRSVHELRSRLRRKQFSPEAIDAAIERLSSWGYLNDEDFARFWVENRQANRPRGERLLVQELRMKGIDRDTIQETIDATEIDEPAVALDLARSKLRSYSSLPPEVAKRRLAGFLTRRGFGYDAIKPVLEQLFTDADDE
jgi:regulatory protein